MTRKLILIWSIFMFLLTTAALISVLYPQYPIPWKDYKIFGIAVCLLIGYLGSFVGFWHWWDIRPVKKSKWKITKYKETIALVEGKDYVILN